MMREIIFDTETTGLEPSKGHRLIEIGAIEMIDGRFTGNNFHEYVHPEDKLIDEGAQNVHGISLESLEGKPFFRDIASRLLEFFSEGKLIAHNAKFDMGFLDAEFARIDMAPLDRSRVIDTVAIARRKFPGSPASLDALCDRFKISRASRTLHGALLDAELLAEVYIDLMERRQAGFNLDVRSSEKADDDQSRTVSAGTVKQRLKPLPSRLTEEEKKAHAAMIEEIGDGALWIRYQ